MGVVNNELARNVGLNGRIPAPTEDNPEFTKHVECNLIPGLNNVDDEQMIMLMANERFELLCDRQEMSVVFHGADAAPDSIDDVDITEMNVKNARKFIESIATQDLLDRIEAQEVAGESRKGVLTTVTDHRKKLTKVIDQVGGKE